MVFYVIFNVTLLRLVDSHVRGSGDVCFFFVLSPKRSLSFQYQEIHQLLPLSDIEPSHHVPKFPKFPKNHTHNYCISTDNQIICVQLKTGVSDLLFSNIILLSFVVDVYMGRSDSGTRSPLRSRRAKLECQPLAPITGWMDHIVANHFVRYRQVIY